MIKFCLKQHILPWLLLTVVVCFVGHNFLKYANLSISKKPRARVVAFSQAQVCKETLKKLELLVSTPVAIVSTTSHPPRFFAVSLDRCATQSTPHLPDGISSSISSRAPPLLS